MSSEAKPSPRSLRTIRRFRARQGEPRLENATDQISVEEPLLITLQQSGHPPFDLTMTMRTPGNDRELAAGLLFSEGIIQQRQDIDSYSYVDEQQNHLNLQLRADLPFQKESLQRHVYTNSACGICGKTALQALEMKHQPRLLDSSPLIRSETLRQLPEQLGNYQQQFAITGGVHSAALVSPDGAIIEAWEDVGRHNAMDKLLGSLLQQQKLPQQDKLVLLSGRLSFELVQKALMADVPALAAIGAPTSLAVDLAQRHNMTLIGFLKPQSFNVYSGAERILPCENVTSNVE